MQEPLRSTAAAYAFYGVVLVLAIFLVLGYYQNVLQYTISNLDSLVWKIDDWPDTGMMMEVVQHGGFFSEYPGSFIAGGSMFGLFPPLLPLLAAAAYPLFGSISLTFVAIAAVFSLLIAWLVLRDWPSWEQKLAVFLLLFCFPILYVCGMTPLVPRLRELFGVFLLALLFKNPFRLRPDANYLVLGAALILTQPMVALIGLLSYPFLNSDGWKPKPDLRSAPVFAALFLLGMITYHQHILLSIPGSAAPTNSLGVVPIVYFLQQGFFVYLLIPALFFFTFAKNIAVRCMVVLFTLWWLSLAAFSGIPAMLRVLTFPLSSDFAFQAFPFLAFFALFPPAEVPKGGYRLLLSALLPVLLLLGNIQVWSSLDYTLHEESDYRALMGSMEDNSTLASFMFFIVEPQRTAFFAGVDMKMLSELYLKDRAVKTYYSPFQQFYDTEGFYAPVSGLLDSIEAQNASSCAFFASNLSRRIDYLHLYLVVRYAHTGGTWSDQYVDRLMDEEFLQKCGIRLAAAEVDDYSVRNHLLYQFSPAGSK